MQTLYDIIKQNPQYHIEIDGSFSVENTFDPTATENGVALTSDMKYGNIIYRFTKQELVDAKYNGDDDPYWYIEWDTGEVQISLYTLASVRA